MYLLTRAYGIFSRDMAHLHVRPYTVSIRNIMCILYLVTYLHKYEDKVIARIVHRSSHSTLRMIPKPSCVHVRAKKQQCIVPELLWSHRTDRGYGDVVAHHISPTPLFPSAVLRREDVEVGHDGPPSRVHRIVGTTKMDLPRI